jgi:hypothetical protein
MKRTNGAKDGTEGKREGKRKERAGEREGVANLLYQVLETEMGGVEVYRTALRCAIHDELLGEWEKYLSETERHVEIARSLLDEFGLDADAELPGRAVVRHIGQALVAAMEKALDTGKPEEAQLVAAECVVEAETKDHMNWGLVGLLAEKLHGDEGKVLREAHQEVEKEEDHHLYHSTGWARELWIQSLGMPAVLPPPEEEKQVETAIGAARAKNARKDML